MEFGIAIAEVSLASETKFIQALCRKNEGRNLRAIFITNLTTQSLQSQLPNHTTSIINKTIQKFPFQYAIFHVKKLGRNQQIFIFLTKEPAREKGKEETYLENFDFE